MNNYSSISQRKKCVTNSFQQHYSSILPTIYQTPKDEKKTILAVNSQYLKKYDSSIDIHSFIEKMYYMYKNFYKTVDK